VLRFTNDGRYVPFAVISTGEERTRVAGDRIAVRCGSCGKPVVLPSSMSLGDVVSMLEAGKRFRHPQCPRRGPAAANPSQSAN
jgi:hypothetical protein